MTEKIELLSRFALPRRVLDHGFVRLVDVMGDDAAIVQAARVSYGAGTETPSTDRDLIRYLLRHWHTSPFEMCEIKLHCKMPIFIARQWIRHRTANVNEMSGRYSVLPEEFYVPVPASICYQSTTNKQGRSGPVDAITADQFAELLEDQCRRAFANYRGACDDEIARETARIGLPLATYTEWYWKIDLHNLMHFLRLRIDSHAQEEIRAYGRAIGEIVKAWAPVAWEAFEDYRLHSVSLSRQELEIVKLLVGATPTGRDGWRDLFDAAGITNKRERGELLAKLGITLGDA